MFHRTISPVKNYTEGLHNVPRYSTSYAFNFTHKQYQQTKRLTSNIFFNILHIVCVKKKKKIWLPYPANKDSQKDTSEDPWKDSSEDPWKDSPEDPQKDSSEDPWKDSSEDPWKDSSEDSQKDSSEYPWKDSSEDPQKDSSADTQVNRSFWGSSKETLWGSSKGSFWVSSKGSFWGSSKGSFLKIPKRILLRIVERILLSNHERILLTIQFVRRIQWSLILFWLSGGTVISISIVQACPWRRPFMSIDYRCAYGRFLLLACAARDDYEWPFCFQQWNIGNIIC